MADIGLMKKIVLLITCKNSFGKHVCELMFGVNVTDLDLGVQIDPIKQPIKSNSVGSGNMSHCRASSLYDHLDHCFPEAIGIPGLVDAIGHDADEELVAMEEDKFIAKDIQQSTRTHCFACSRDAMPAPRAEHAQA